uniref:Uncharacterized protein n=1 Tax=Caenorhabditis japonica TaxID=281687 RepID=A0A8R1IB13_CAEJA
MANKFIEEIHDMLPMIRGVTKGDMAETRIRTSRIAMIKTLKKGEWVRLVGVNARHQAGGVGDYVFPPNRIAFDHYGGPTIKP